MDAQQLLTRDFWTNSRIFVLVVLACTPRAQHLGRGRREGMAFRDAYAVGRGFWLKVKKSVAIVDGHGGAAYGLFVDDKLAPISPVKVSSAPLPRRCRAT